jgi:hypothetical protein
VLTNDAIRLWGKHWSLYSIGCVAITTRAEGLQKKGVQARDKTSVQVQRTEYKKKCKCKPMTKTLISWFQEKKRMMLTGKTNWGAAKTNLILSIWSKQCKWTVNHKMFHCSSNNFFLNGMNNLSYSFEKDGRYYLYSDRQTWKIFSRKSL